MRVTLTYDRGSILVGGGVHVPNSRWDERVKSYRALAMHYADILEYLRDFEVEDDVLNLLPCPDFAIKSGVRLRDYQKKAVSSWMREKKGVVALPTGAGKTVVAVQIIADLNAPSLICVPTLDLLRQWRDVIKKHLDVEAGCYSGEERRLEAITVATYDTAYLRIEELGNKFELIVFDEVHHLPSEGYRHIAEFSAAPYRLGLTATHRREDGLHSELPRLVGGIVYEEKIHELAGEHLADFRLEKIFVDLTEDERREYDREYKKYLDYVRSHNIKLKTRSDFRFFVMRTGRDKNARAALIARNRARVIALNSGSKLGVLADLLEKHRDDRMIVFTEHNQLVYNISHRFLIPSITHKTGRREREDVLSKFRAGEYSKIVSSKVLDEGVDVPEANVGVILSGTGSRREFVQRLGRILRKKEGKTAVLYEIVSKKTTEEGASHRRKRERK